MLILRVRVRMRYMGTRLQLSLGGRQAWELGWGGEGEGMECPGRKARNTKITHDEAMKQWQIEN